MISELTKGPAAAPRAPEPMTQEVKRVWFLDFWLIVTMIGQMGPPASEPMRTSDEATVTERFKLRIALPAIIPKAPIRTAGQSVQRCGRVSVSIRPAIIPVQKRLNRWAAEPVGRLKCFSK